MNVILRVRTIALLMVVSMLLVALPQVASAADGDGEVTEANVYLRDQAAEPWGSEENDAAMDTVFGADNWEEEYFQTVNTGTGTNGLFAPGVRFIFLDGSDDGADDLEAFLAANESALKSFVARGGRLIINSAPNEGDGMSYDGRQIVYDDVNDDFNDANEVVAADGTHPIFNGPNTPAGTSYSGNSFGHALIQGAGLTPLILRRVNDEENEPGDPNAVVLAEYRVCNGGITLLGGMTMPMWHDPDPNGQNLRANIIHYAANVAIGACAAGPTTTPQVSQATPPARDTRRPRVTIAGVRRRGCVSRNFRARIRVDESALRRVDVYLDGRRLRRTTRSTFSVKVPARGARAGRHRLTVIARDPAGNRRRTTRRFTRCARKAQVRRQPRFTG